MTVLLVVGYSLHTSSCASTKAAPSGGPKDTIPPVVVGAKPLENTVNFPLDEGEIYIAFNEYVQLKDAYKNILLSPPQKKNVKTRIKGKGIKDLRSNSLGDEYIILDIKVPSKLTKEEKDL